VSGSASTTLGPAYATRLIEILDAHRAFRRHVIPLCAAETPISAYVRQFLSDPIHEKYAMGGPAWPLTENFVGAEHVLDLHQLTIDLCRDIYGAYYADPRPLSGTGAVTNLLMTLSQPGQRILLQTTASGGHASMWPICARLGLDVVPLPYDYDRLDFDEAGCQELAGDGADFVLIAPSDILYAPDIASLGFQPTTTVIYDATQTLGLIASRHLESPLDAHPRLVISGGTHKTLPGPSSGLLMTNSADVAERLDSELSPKFVRHSHPHHMAALCATLIEHRAIGRDYSDRIGCFAKVLSSSLARAGLQVVQDGDRITETHQVFLHVPAAQLDDAYARAAAAGITVNAKRKPLFRDTGLRLGVQEIARYVWTEAHVDRLGGLLAALVADDGSDRDWLRAEVVELARLNVFAEGMHLPATPA
jgi:glycine hydroxymethyltransferase